MNSAGRLFFIVGTTAVGKSALAMEAAEGCGGHLVNADSLQLYQRLNIGTAKPTQADYLRVPHHLFDIIEPGRTMTAGEYHDIARKKVSEMLLDSPVFLVGGSGFYLQAFEKGMLPAPKSAPAILNQLQDKLHTEGEEALFSELMDLDPEYAERVNQKDHYRVMRALSIMREAGRSMTEVARDFARVQKQQRFPTEALKVGLFLDRDELRARVEARLEGMVQAGLRQEVEALVELGFADWKPLQSVGYKETLQLLRGEINRDEWLPLMVTSTMQLAKRQKTWFKRDKSIKWFHAESERVQALEFIDLEIKKGSTK